MQMRDFMVLLGDLEVFRGLRPDQLEKIARSMDRIVFRTGQPIIEEGKDGDGAVLLISGVAEATPPGGEPEPVAPGSLVGEMAMLIEHQHRVTVVTRSSARGLKISRGALHRAMLEDPSLADHFVQRLNARLTRVAVELRRIDELLLQAAEQPAV